MIGDQYWSDFDDMVVLPKEESRWSSSLKVALMQRCGFVVRIVLPGGESDTAQAAC